MLEYSVMGNCNRVPSFFAALAMILLLVCSGCSRKQNTKETVIDNDQPNVLLITLDTTRSDRLGCYGYSKARTPNLDQLAKSGIRFEQAFTPLPFTLPSHTSIMTGLYPFYHGVRENTRFRVAPELHTIAEAFEENHYQTAAILGAFVLDRQFGLNQGFENYFDKMPALDLGGSRNVPERNARQVVDTTLDWFDSIDATRPWFCWVHFYDPHYPYKPPMSFPYSMSDPYDAEIAYMDQQIGDLLDKIPGDRPLVICVAGDHGEGLGDHGEITHGYFVYNPTLSVPFIVNAHNQEQTGVVVSTPVSLVDIMPTLLELASLPVPGHEEIHGRSLVPLIEGVSGADAEFEERLIYFETYAPTYNFGWAPQYGGVHESWKYIHSPDAELYNLEENPGENLKDNLVSMEPDRASRMDSDVRELRNQSLAFPPATGEGGPLDAEAVRKLQSLGYLSGATLNIDDDGDRPDLKTKLLAYQQAKAAEGLIRTGQVREGVAELLRLHRENPESPAFVTWLADSLRDRPLDAVEAIPVVLKAGQDANNPTTARAEFLAWVGQAKGIHGEQEEGLALLNEAARLDPSNAQIWSRLGAYQVVMNDIQGALSSCRKAVSLAPEEDSYGVQLSVVLLRANKLQEASKSLGTVLTTASVWKVEHLVIQEERATTSLTEQLDRIAALNGQSDSVRCFAYLVLSTIQASIPVESLALYQKAYALLPDAEKDPVAQFRYGQLLRLNQQDDMAEIRFRNAAQLDPDFFPAVRDYCLLLRDSGKVDKAVLRMETFRAKHPDNPDAASSLAALLLHQKTDLHRALKLAKEAAWYDDGNAYYAATLGQVYLAMDNAKSAIHSLNLAVRRNPSVPYYHYCLGLALRLDKQNVKAQESFQQAIRLASGTSPTWLKQAQEYAAE